MGEEGELTLQQSGDEPDRGFSQLQLASFVSAFRRTPVASSRSSANAGSARSAAAGMVHSEHSSFSRPARHKRHSSQRGAQPARSRRGRLARTASACSLPLGSQVRACLFTACGTEPFFALSTPACRRRRRLQACFARVARIVSSIPRVTLAPMHVALLTLGVVTLRAW